MDLGFIKILRLLRILRPLRLLHIINLFFHRFISHNENMKLVVMALMESVAGIINVTIVILLIWFFIYLINNIKCFRFRIMFGILGINLMKDKLGYCEGVKN